MASMRRETCKAGPLPLARRNSPRPGSVSRPAAVYLPVDSPPRARPNGHSSRPGSKNLNSGSTSASAPPVMATVAAAASKGLSQMDGTQAIHGMTASETLTNTMASASPAQLSPTAPTKTIGRVARSVFIHRARSCATHQIRPASTAPPSMIARRYSRFSTPATSAISPHLPRPHESRHRLRLPWKARNERQF